MDYFQRAVNKDPAFALGYAGLSQSYGLLYNYGGGAAAESFLRAEQAALKALEIDGSLAAGHLALAQVKAAYHWEWSAAERGFRIALDLNPGNATAHHWYAVYLVGQGRFDEALIEMRRAQDLDPLSLIVHTFTGQALYSARRYEEAMYQLQETLKLDPDFGIARLVLGLAYIKKSKYDEAVTVLQRARDLWGENPRVISTLGVRTRCRGIEQPRSRYSRN